MWYCMEKIIVIGSGGHSSSLVDILESRRIYDIAGYIVNDIRMDCTSMRYPILGCDDDLEAIFKGGITNAAVGIGYMGESKVREKLWAALKNIGYTLPTVCDSTAIVSSSARIEEGCFIGKGAIINSNASIGKMCIINSGAIIEHDCVVGDFSHISVGSVLCGNVNIGDSAFIGANATVIQGLNIGTDCIVGAGCTLRKDLENQRMYIGDCRKNIARD